MKFKISLIGLVCALGAAGVALAADGGAGFVYKAGHPSLKSFVLPAKAPHPADNAPNAARVELGAKLYFDPRLSGDGIMSCATCHNPGLGWSDALPRAKGVKSMELGRASPTILNTAYNSIQMWDGRKASLEDQAMGPMQADVEMNSDIVKTFKWLNESAGYKALFEKAYPGEGVTEATFSKAIASFERTAAISNQSPFDAWVKGNAKAMTAEQVQGFKLFNGKANCIACHSGANFTDNGFHNVGLASFGNTSPDMGRFAHKAVATMKGAFKTPTVRDIERTAPYFHDGSAATLAEVVEHYARGGDVKTNLSPNMKPLDLTAQEKQALVAFMKALTSPYKPVAVPELPMQ